MDIRWKQRLQSFSKVLYQLKSALAITEIRPLSDLKKQRTIQVFEYCYALSWNTIKDFYQFQGDTELQGSRDAYRLAFNRGFILNGETWMKMIKSRILTSHTYNQAAAEEILGLINNEYIHGFIPLEKALKEYENKNGS